MPVKQYGGAVGATHLPPGLDRGIKQGGTFRTWRAKNVDRPPAQHGIYTGGTCYVAIDNNDNVYVGTGNTLFKYDKTGAQVWANSGGTYNAITGVATDGTNVWATVNQATCILSVNTSTGAGTAINSNNINPTVLRYNAGNLYLVQSSNTVAKYTTAGTLVSSIAAGVGTISDMRFDPSGNVYVFGNNATTNFTKLSSALASLGIALNLSTSVVRFDVGSDGSIYYSTSTNIIKRSPSDSYASNQFSFACPTNCTAPYVFKSDTDEFFYVNSNGGTNYAAHGMLNPSGVAQFSVTAAAAQGEDWQAAHSGAWYQNGYYWLGVYLYNGTTTWYTLRKFIDKIQF